VAMSADEPRAAMSAKEQPAAMSAEEPPAAMSAEEPPAAMSAEEPPAAMSAEEPPVAMSAKEQPLSSIALELISTLEETGLDMRFVREELGTKCRRNPSLPPPSPSGSQNDTLLPLELPYLCRELRKELAPLSALGLLPPPIPKSQKRPPPSLPSGSPAKKIVLSSSESTARQKMPQPSPSESPPSSSEFTARKKMPPPSSSDSTARKKMPPSVSGEHNYWSGMLIIILLVLLLLVVLLIVVLLIIVLLLVSQPIPVYLTAEAFVIFKN